MLSINIYGRKADKETVKYNFILTILIIASSATSSYAQSCKELVDSVFAIETKLKTTTLPLCSIEKGILKDCCSMKDAPEMCQNINQIELAYNKALAEVNIHESLLAIGQTAVNDHRVLKRLSADQLKSARELVEKFESSIRKRDLIDSALFVDKSDNVKVAQTLWNGYTASNQTELIIELNKKCSGASKAAFSDFCKRLTTLDKNKGYNLKEKETLYNFYKSQRLKANGQESDEDMGKVVDRFEKYRNYLAINVDGKEIEGPFAQSKYYTDYVKLKDLLPKEKENRVLNGKESELILEKAASLSKLSIDMKDVKFSDNELFAGNFTKDVVNELKTNVLQVESSTSILTNQNQILANIENADKSMELEIKAKESIAKENIRSNVKLNKVCSSTNNLNECAIKICGIDYKKGSCSVDEYNNIGSFDIATEIARIEKSKSLKEVHARITTCAKKIVPIEREACLDSTKNLREGLSTTSLSQAQEELKKSRKLFSTYLKKDPFTKLAVLKKMNIAALQDKGCLEGAEERSARIDSYCKTPGLDGHVNNVLNLETSVSKITMKMNMELQDDHFKKIYGDEKNNKNFEEAAALCAEGLNKKMAVCKYMQASSESRQSKADQEEYNKNTRIEKERVRKENFYAGWKEENDGPTAFESGITGLATGVAGGMPQIFGMIQQKRQHDRQMNYYQSLYDYRQRTYDSNFTNYQPQYYWNNYQDPLTFNANPTAAIDMSGFNYNFSSIPSSLSGNNAQTPIFTSPAPASIPSGGSDLGFDFGN